MQNVHILVSYVRFRSFYFVKSYVKMRVLFYAYPNPNPIGSCNDFFVCVSFSDFCVLHSIFVMTHLHHSLGTHSLFSILFYFSHFPLVHRGTHIRVHLLSIWLYFVFSFFSFFFSLWIQQFSYILIMHMHKRFSLYVYYNLFIRVLYSSSSFSSLFCLCVI